MATADKLLSARLKIDRANKHISDLEAALVAFKNTNPAAIRGDFDEKTRCYSYILERFDDIPVDVGLIAADALFNLRSALDHTAMQLWIASGSTGSERNVMFPIFDSSTKYFAERRRRIQGARPDIVKSLDTIEPYKGGKGELLWVLHSLNNTDKHRLLLTVGAGHCGYDIYPIVARKLAAGRPGSIPSHASFEVNSKAWQCPLEAGAILHTTRPDEEFYEDMKFTFQIAFSEPGVLPRESMLKTLQDMSKLVANVIDQLGRLL